MKTIDSKLTLVTGLHIGGADDGMKIGGVDSPVMKREVFCDSESGEIGFVHKRKIEEPYIAGSSLKGKVRTLLEHYFKLIDPIHADGKPIGSNNKHGEKAYTDLIVSLFGDSADGRNIRTKNKDKIEKIEVTRAVFRDCFITKEVRKAYLENRINLFESKYENVIDRKTGTTIGGGLRQIERVPSAIEFDFTISIRVFKDDNESLLKNTILLGLKLLELDALGGNGSRGYGRIHFNDISEEIKELDEKIKNEINKG